MAKHEYRVIDTYPCPKLVAPYFYIVVRQAKAEITSIYRGEDPVGQALENKYGHHSQGQLVAASPAQRREWGVQGTPNPVDESTHEWKSDGRAFPSFPVHADLLWWMGGLDVNGAAQAEACIRAARRFKWVMFRPYKTGVEEHHLCFEREPVPHNKAMAARVIAVRAMLPRS